MLVNSPHPDGHTRLGRGLIMTAVAVVAGTFAVQMAQR